MAVGDIQVLSGGLGVKKFRTDDRTTDSSRTATIKPGEPLKRTTNFATHVATGDPENGTDIFLGISKEESTETATADGTVDVELVGPGTVLRGKATTASNMTTDSALLAFLQDYVTFDVSGSPGTITIDEDEGDDPNVHGLFIIDGDIVKGTLDVLTASSTIFHSTV